jgi:hypothetical protein
MTSVMPSHIQRCWRSCNRRQVMKLFKTCGNIIIFIKVPIHVRAD